MENTRLLIVSDQSRVHRQYQVCVGIFVRLIDTGTAVEYRNSEDIWNYMTKKGISCAVEWTCRSKVLCTA